MRWTLMRCIYARCNPIRYIPMVCTPEITALILSKLMLIVHDKPLGRRGVGWHTVVCYGGPE
jgi:hypothetical protein